MSATEATIKTFEFKIIAPKNETITVTMGDGTVYTVKGTDTESVTKDDLKIAYGTKWSATVSAEDVAVAGTTVGQCLLNGEYNTEETYNLQIPDNVTQIAVRGHYGPHHVADLLQTYYINNILYTVIETSSNNNQAEVLVTPGSNITIKAGATLEAKPNNDYDYLDSWGVYVLKTSNTSSSSSSSSTSTTAGNLIVNGVDTGSTTGSGTVTGIISVSAGVTAENTIFDGCQWEYTEVNSETTKNTFEETDENYNFGFTTCKNTKYLFIVAGGNLEEAEDDGDCIINLLNEKMVPYEIYEKQTISSLGYGVDARVLVEVSPNKKYYTYPILSAQMYGFFDWHISVKEIDPETVTINSDGKTANADSLTNAGVIQYKNISFYRCL